MVMQINWFFTLYDRMYIVQAELAHSSNKLGYSIGILYIK